MSNYKCANCPETMYSKCPSSRTIFPSNQYVTALNNTLVLGIKPYNEGSKFNCLTVEYGCLDPEESESKKEVFKGFMRRIRSFTDEEIEILVCNHKWYLEEGEVCDLEGHSHSHHRPVINEDTEVKAPILSEEERDASWEGDKA